jgi:beta-glucanase (GH16 family)
MSESGFILGYNLHYYYGTDPDYVDKNLGYDLFNNDKPFNLIKLTESMTQEHIYGLFWEPSKFTIFFDNKEIASYYDEEHMPNHRLNILINFAIDPWYKPKTETNFPATFKVNYINIYQLKYTDDCSEVVEPFNKISYTNSVKKSVVLENTSLSLSDNIHIWATDYILFNSVTEISTSTNGSFSVYVTSCPINVD